MTPDQVAQLIDELHGIQDVLTWIAIAITSGVLASLVGRKG